MGWLLLALAGLVSVGVLLWLEIRTERRNKERIEAEDMADYEAHVRRTKDWAWPSKPPAAEYVAKERERIR